MVIAVILYDGDYWMTMGCVLLLLLTHGSSSFRHASRWGHCGAGPSRGGCGACPWSTLSWRHVPGQNSCYALVGAPFLCSLLSSLLCRLSTLVHVDILLVLDGGAIQDCDFPGLWLRLLGPGRVVVVLRLRRVIMLYRSTAPVDDCGAVFAFVGGGFVVLSTALVGDCSVIVSFVEKDAFVAGDCCAHG